MTERDRDGGDDGDAPLDLSAWAAPPPPRRLTARVMDAVRAGGDDTSEVTIDDTRARRPIARPRWPGLAAGFAAAIAAAALTWALWPRSLARPPASGHVVAAAPSKLALGGGTVALLGAGAELTWQLDDGGLAVDQASGIITYQHPGPAGLVITTPLATVHTAGASLQVEVPMNKQLVAGVVGAGLAAAIVIAVYEGRAEVRQPSAAPRVVEGGGQVAIAPPTAPRPTFTPVARAVKDRAQRDALAAAIAGARAARTAPGATTASAAGVGPGGAALTTGPGGTATTVDLTPGELSKDEIRDGVREVIPMLTDCYELMLDKHPAMAGQVVAKLVLDHEPDLGTIVTMEDDSAVAMTGAARGADDHALRADLNDFRQCLTATLESVALPPLGDKDGGRIEVTYPFVFAVNEDDEDDEDDEDAGDSPPPRPSQRQTPPDPTAATPEEQLTEAENAAKSSQWASALKRSETVLRRSDSSPQVASRAAMVATLAACHLKSRRKAQQYYARVTPGAKKLVEQGCLRNGIEVRGDDASDDDPTSDIMDPFRSRTGSGAAPTPAPPPKRADDGVDIKDPFR